MGYFCYNEPMRSYGEGFRARVDSLKEVLRNENSMRDNEADFEEEKIDREPGFFRKLGRTALDLVNIHPYASEQRRNREAMGTALKEYREEVEETKAKKAEKELEDFNQKLEKNTEEKLKSEVRKILKDDQFLAYEMGAMRESRRSEAIRNERVQESVERELNSKLTTIDDLEDAVNAEDPGIEKRFIEYDGEKIPVYDLKGLPYVILSTALDYRYRDEQGPSSTPTIGEDTMKELLENPAVWATPEYEMEKQEGYGEWFGSKKARGNTISASYVNSKKRNTNDRRVHQGGAVKITGTYKNLCYGFAHVEGDSVIRVTLGDGGNSNGIGHNKTELSNPDVVENMENKNHPTYNEVLLRRYSETGMPKKPDFIIAEDGEITETVLKHAKFWGIPIINIETKHYEDHVRMTDEEWQKYQEEQQETQQEAA